MFRKSWFVSALILGVFCSPVAKKANAEPNGRPISGNTSSAGDPDLADGFRDPPLSARPAAYWCWLNGNTNLPQLTRELEEIKDKGLSGVYIFDVGAQDPDGVVPAGPAFMGPQSVKAIGHAVREATRLGLRIGLITSSSWNAGGSWVTPEHASMGLYHCQTTVAGPARYSDVLPFPSVPKKAPKGPDGLPVYYKDVAVLAMPQLKRLPGHEFVFELAPPGMHTIDRVDLYNTPSDDQRRYGKLHLFAKDFSVLTSATTAEAKAFKEVVRGSLQPTVDAQRFDLKPIQARYVKLMILSGHNPKYDQIQLGEFEVYSSQGENVAAAYHADGSKTGAKLLHCSSALGHEGEWTAANIHDGAKSGAHGSWCSAGPPATVIEDVASIVDLTGRVDKRGRLVWNVPPGKWTIMRLVCANTGQGLAIPSPNSQGLAIDHFSPAATEMHFQYIIDRLRAELGGFENTALKTMYVCSYELRGSTWTPNFLQEFRRRRGYDMTPYLPVLFGSTVQSHEVTERFQYDFRKTLGDLLVDAFYRKAREISNKHGLLLCAEAGGPGPPLHQVPVDALKALGALDIPRGEFWKEHNVWVVKETACASHIYGKGVVDMEAFTSWRHWQDGPFELKPIADRAICGGTNHFTFHTSAHNPPEAGKPGWVYHAGTHINPNLAWWPKAGPFVDYLARCSYLLQQGLFVGDVCYYYGDQGFNFVPPKHVDPSLGYGYDYDVTNAEVILTRMGVKDGRIALPDGMGYELLVLPDREDMDWEVLQKLEGLVAAGATVVGRKPGRSNGLTDYPNRDQQVRNLADKLWGPCDGQNVKEHSYGKGKIIWGRSLREVLRARGIGPDFGFTSRDREADLDYIHRRTQSDDIYFVSNKGMGWADVDCVFRTTGKTPELWMPDTGEIRKLTVYDSVEGGTKVPLRLPPAGSVFVVFRGNGGTDPRKASQGKTFQVAAEALPVVQEITGPWEIRFPEGWGAPASKVLPKLISWTEDPEEGIRYFSGIATYQKQFDLPPELVEADQQLVLDLGRVWAVADVYLNGKHLGVLWKPPFQLDITRAARPGTNRLVIEVANTWSNRLVGDANSPESKRYCRTNMKKALTWTSPWKETPLLESGLMGPVRLLAAEPNTKPLDAAVERVEQLGGRIEHDQGGVLIGVDLPECQADDDDLKTLRVLTGLQRLKVWSTWITDKGLQHLNGFPELRRLHLLFANLTDDGMVQLKGLTRLEVLDLRGCVRIGDAGVAQLAGLKNLKTLKLQTPMVTDAGVKHLTRLTELRTLALEQTFVSDAGLVHLKSFPQLEELSLLQCDNVTDRGLAGLRSLANLRRLNLRGTPITGSGLAHLPVPGRLKKLDLSQTPATDAALENLAGCTELEWLNLWQTQLTDAGLEHLKGLSKLAWLNLNNTRTSDTGLKHLAVLTSLESLDLQQTEITDAGLQSLRKLTRLKELNLTLTFVTEEAVGQLQAALPECKIEW